MRGNGPIYWKNAFGVNQEVSVILTTVASAGLEQDLLLKVQGGASPNWGTGVIEVSYNAPTNSVIVYAFRPATLQWFAYPGIPVTFANGDEFGARPWATGDVVIFRRCRSRARDHEYCRPNLLTPKAETSVFGSSMPQVPS